MKVIYHPEFPKHIKRFEAQYREVSEALAVRFRQAIDDAIQRIKASPGSAGHFVNTGSRVVRCHRPRVAPDRQEAGKPCRLTPLSPPGSMAVE